uniref:Uncharacterized protein n=1 Tax=Oryza rufipogon TaxID=4529 RepID=A0A0E0RCT5_ORYRU
MEAADLAPRGWIRRLHAGSGQSKPLPCGNDGKRRWRRLAIGRLVAASAGGRHARKTRWRPVVEAAVAKAGAGVTMAGAGASGGGSVEPAGASARPRLPPPPPAVGSGGYGLDGLCVVAGPGWRCADPQLVVGSVEPAAGYGLDSCGLRCQRPCPAPSSLPYPPSSLRRSITVMSL